ncbi:CAP domain-containing protein [Paenibacillus sp. EC2-1]|uniref:CAP domain-containing protein n=1 Tax=Paenibacillus sp. EC2-1 TaxID=3388665 RepID=UPI003BEEECD0
MASSLDRRKTRLRWMGRVLALCILLHSSYGILYADTYQAYAESGVTSYSKDQLEALDYLNMVRSKAGLKPVTLDPHVTQAAIAHAKYYNQNKEEKVSLSAHQQVQGKPGFTGKSASDRIKAAGYQSPSRFGFGYGEVMGFQKKTSTDAMKEWLNTAYHRVIILDSSYQKIGIGLVDGTAVVDLVSEYQSTPQVTNDLTVYPYDGMTDSVVGFYGHEIPNPLQQFGVDFSGAIISAVANEKIASYNAVIKNEKGQVVPHFHELYASKKIFLYPKEILEGYHTYKVSIEAVLADSGKKLNRSWSFKTGKGRQLQYIDTLYPELIINTNSPEQLYIQGRYDDRTTQTNPAGLIFTSSKNSGLSITDGGLVTGKSPGVYTVTVRTPKGAKTQIKVSVLQKLIMKKYMGSNAAKYADIQKHDQKSSIEWALQSGVMTGYADGSFKPQQTVSEAEFWVMFLKMLNIHYDAYKPAKSTNWADGAYQIAESRNIPLAGIKDVKLRNQNMTRQKAADMITAADGKNFSASVQYVLAMDYMRGVTSRSIQGFESNKALTRADAAVLLHYLQPKLKELKGRPKSKTADEALPKMPVQEYYQKPAKLEDKSIIVEYTAEGKLNVEGKFQSSAGETHTLMVQTKDPETGKMKAIQDFEITADEQGKFSYQSAAPYQEEMLVIYLKVKKINTYYSIEVNRGTINMQKYSL